MATFSNAVDADFEIKSPSAGLITIGPGTGALSIQAGGAAAIRVLTTGNVGIGTATPVGRADVAGTSVNQSGWGLLSVQSNDAQGADKGGSITFGGVYDASTATHWAQISGRKENGTSGQYGGYLAFATRTNGAGTNTERARIDSSGNVGIGTASPYARASVRGGSNDGIGVWSTAVTTAGSPIGGSLFLGDANFYNAGFYNQAPGLSAVFDVSTSVAAALAFYTYSGTNRIERARIDSAGNLGIGTPSPAGRLDVVGVAGLSWAIRAQVSSANTSPVLNAELGINLKNTSATVGNYTSITNRDSSDNANAQINFINVNNSGSGAINFVTRDSVGGSGERARIDSAGRMCIGTTTATTGRALTTVADLDVFGVRVGRGAGDDAESTALGAGALAVQTSGARYNTAIGRSALTTVAGGRFNTAVGWSALKFVTSGENNTAIGIDALGGIDTTSQNAAVGREAGRYISGGGSLTAASDSVFIGYNARANANSESNQIVIGAGATGNGSNTVTIGNSSNVGTFLDTKYVRLVDSYTVGTLPAAGTAGRIARVTDGDAALAWGATVVNTGAGATPYLVWDNGTNWTVFGK
jgi:hypothetical protein